MHLKIPSENGAHIVSPPQWFNTTRVDIFSGAIDLIHKSHNAPVPYPTMHHFVTEMCACIFLLQNGALWDIFLLHGEICEMGLLDSPDNCWCKHIVIRMMIKTVCWYYNLNLLQLYYKHAIFPFSSKLPFPLHMVDVFQHTKPLFRQFNSMWNVWNKMALVMGNGVEM